MKLIFVRSKETGRLYLVKRYPRAYLEQGINNAKRGKKRRTFTGTILSITGWIDRRKIVFTPRVMRERFVLFYLHIRLLVIVLRKASRILLSRRSGSSSILNSSFKFTEKCLLCCLIIRNRELIVTSFTYSWQFRLNFATVAPF